MSLFYNELELIKPISDYFKNMNFVVKREIRIGFYRADIVAFKNNSVTAVELKLHDWKKAIIQAKNYQLGTDYVYIAFPLNKSYNILRKAEYLLRKEGIGLLIVNEKTLKVCKILEAMKSKKNYGTITLWEIKRKSTKLSKMKYF